jgi:hypothetical protein
MNKISQFNPEKENFVSLQNAQNTFLKSYKENAPITYASSSNACQKVETLKRNNSTENFGPSKKTQFANN